MIGALRVSFSLIGYELAVLLIPSRTGAIASSGVIVVLCINCLVAFGD